jgi:hypothetical protein
MMIGLDIGPTVIRACLFDGKFGRYTFVRAVEEFVPNSFPTEATDNDETDLEDPETEEVDASIMEQADLERRQASAIRSLLRGIKVDGLVSHISTKSVSLRIEHSPFTDHNQIATTLPGTIEAKVLFDIDDIQLQHRIIKPLDSGTQLLVLLTPLDVVEGHLDRMEGLDCNPQHILVDGEAIGYYGSTGVQVTLHFTDNTIVCNITQDGDTLSFKTVPLNGYSPADGTLPTAILESLRRVLIHFEDTLQVDIEEILLSGEHANSIDFQTHMSEEMGVPCSQIELPNAIQPKFGLAYALGQKACGVTKGREFDLRHGSLAYTGNIQRIAMVLQVVAVASLIGFIGFTGWFWTQKSAINTEIEQLNADIVTQVQTTMPDLPNSILSSPSTVASLMQEEIATATQKLDKLGSITADEPPVLTLVKNISESLPPHSQARIDVSEMIISKASINLKAETDGFQTATEIEQTLKQNPKFKQAQKADEKSMRDGIRFSIIIPLEATESEEEEG